MTGIMVRYRRADAGFSETTLDRVAATDVVNGLPVLRLPGAHNIGGRTRTPAHDILQKSAARSGDLVSSFQ